MILQEYYCTMTPEKKGLILIISICMIVISIDAVLSENAFDAQKIVNDSLDSFGLTAFFVGSMRFALSGSVTNFL